jgi:Icc-related predicted phosphoesterase
MKIHYASDLHFELNTEIHPSLFKIEGDVLVLGGDITCARFLQSHRSDAEARSHVRFMLRLRDEVFPKFKQVIYLMGNHEHYGFYVRESSRIFSEFFGANEFDNVYFLNDDGIIVDNVLFIGGTLWTNLSNPMDAVYVENGMNDYRVIYTNDFTQASYEQRQAAMAKGSKYAIPMKAEDTNEYHFKTLDVIKKYLQNNSSRKTVVLTHHAPSFKSVHHSHTGSALNPGYATELSEFILDYEPTAWIHGHTHHSVNYLIGNTQILSAQAGYKNYEPSVWKSFKPGVLEI